MTGLLRFARIDGKSRVFRWLVFVSLIAEADARRESLSQNHPFVDGNKRTPFGAMFAFLAIKTGPP